MKKLLLIISLFSTSFTFSQDSTYNANFNKVLNQLRTNEYLKGFYLADSMYLLAKKEENLNQQANFLILKAAVYSDILNIKMATKLNLEAIDLYKKTNNKYMQGWAYSVLLSNYVYDENYNKVSQLLPFLKPKLKDDFLLFYVYEMELRALYKQEKYNELLNIVDLYIEEIKLSPFKSEEYKKEVYRYNVVFKILRTFSLIKSNEKKNVEPILNQLINVNFETLFWIEENDLKYQPEIYQHKIDMLLARKSFDSIPFYFKKYAATNSKLIEFVKNNNKKQKITTNELLAKEKQIIKKNATLQIQSEKKQKRLIIIINSIIISVIILFAYLRRKKAKILSIKNKRINLLNKQLNRVNRKLSDENKKNQELIEFNQRNIFSKTMQISTLKDNLKNISYTIRKLTETDKPISKVDLFRIENSLETIIVDNDIWNEFKMQFEKIRPTFFNQLKKINPKLTVNDLKHSAYIITNLKTKDVANLTNTSPRSIETARYRLTKKLKIPNGIKLYDFLNNLDNNT